MLNKIIGDKLMKDIIKFGGYNWLVQEHDTKNNKILLLFDGIWDKRLYNREQESITWADCTLRKELNNEFYNTIPLSERGRIIKVRNENPKNPWFGTNGGIATEDYIFILSLYELGDDMLKRGINPNERSDTLQYPSFGIYSSGFHNQYSESRIAKDADGVASWWWLRSPGLIGVFAATVLVDGYVDVIGLFVSAVVGGVRPALWLNI